MGYNRIQNNFWIDKKVRKWDFKTRMIALYILSNQHSISEGYYRLPVSYIAEDMVLQKEEINKSIEKLVSDNFIKYDTNNSMILIINALKYQPLQNINHCKAALNKLKQLPSSPLLKDFIKQAEKFNTKFYNFLEKESKDHKFLKKVFRENKGTDSKLQKGLNSNRMDALQTNGKNSQALSLTLTPTQSQTQTRKITNISQKETFSAEEQQTENNSLSPAEELCFYLIKKIADNNPRASLPKKEISDPLFKKWTKEIERLHRLGPVGAKKNENKGYSWQEIRNIIDFSQQDQFWKTNILSSKKLRKQVIMLESKMKNSKSNSSQKKTNKLKELYLAAKEEEVKNEKK